MQNTLFKYLENRFKVQPASAGALSFITISRAYGCPSREISIELVEKINSFYRDKGDSIRWKWVNKEVIENSAKELQVEERKIEEVFNMEEKSVVEDIIHSLSHRHYPNDIKIRKTIKDVIRSFALAGRYVIIGRAGVAITSDMPGGIHIRLDAPLEWRAAHVMKTQKLDHEEAIKKINDMDKKRDVFRNQFVKSPSEEIHFDVIFNCERLNVTQIVEASYCLLTSKTKL